jgi:uncharacterized protein YhjY with autotransporter beta-barrel domain/subtilisin-like proprotein convertase family protein
MRCAFVAFACLGVSTLSAQTIVNVDAGGPIPPAGTAGTSIFTFTVAGLGTITDLDVRIAVSHTFDGDLRFTLASPTATSVILFNRRGGGGDNLQDTLFDDSAAIAISAGVAPFSGSFQPEALLAAFNGQNPNGIWTLTVEDLAGGDVGTLYAAGEAAPWGAAIGTQLIFLTPALAAGAANPTAAPVIESILVIDVGAIQSLLRSGLPLAAAQRHILLHSIQTATRDVGGRLFRLRAGLRDSEESGAAGPTGASDGKSTADAKESKYVVEESFRRWELFTAGDYGSFDVENGRSLTGFDSDVWVATVGAEYRLTKNITFGLAASYLKSDTDLSRNIGGLTTEGMAFSAYGSAVWQNFYFDLLYSYGALDEDIQRRTGTGSIAHGDVENRSNNIEFNTGYSFQFGQLRTGPLASIEWIHGELEGYSEIGGGSAALEYSGQSYDSLISRLGWQASLPIKTGFGEVTPQIRASWDHEYLNSSDSVSASLLTSPFTTISASGVSRGDRVGASAETAQPGRDYLNLGAGVAAQFGDRISASLEYETHLFQQSAIAHFGSVRVSVAF